MISTHDLLNKLTSNFESKGHSVKQSLLDPVPISEIAQRCEWFPADIPASVIALYSWRGGQAKDAWEEEYPFWFRDMSFISLDQAEKEYISMMESYGVENSIEEDGIELKTSFPFAAFNGGWYVVPSSPNQWSGKHQLPVVCVFQGIDMFFHSVESMLKTCCEWVSHPEWSSDVSDLDEDIEMIIWKKYNPNIFEDEI